MSNRGRTLLRSSSTSALFRLVLLCLVPACGSASVAHPIVPIRTLEELQDFVSRAKGGETAQLQPGFSGPLIFTDFNPSNSVTITASKSDNIVVSVVKVTKSKNIRFVGLRLGRDLLQGEPAYFSHAVVRDSSRVSFEKCSFQGGSGRQPAENGIGVNAIKSTNLKIAGSSFTNLRLGATANFSQNVVISENRFQGIGVDGIVMAQVADLSVVGNTFSDWASFDTPAHPDAIQFMTAGTSESSSRIRIEDNIIIQGSGRVFQGIFFRDEKGNLPFTDIVVRNNFILSDQWNGITVQHGRNVSISWNTVVSSSGANVTNRIWLKNIERGSVCYNVADAYIFDSASVMRRRNQVGKKVNTSKVLRSGPQGMDLRELSRSDIGYQPGAIPRGCLDE